MKSTLLILLTLSGFALSQPKPPPKADASRYVAVASYRNTPEMIETVGQRARAVLRGQNIESVAAGSFGMTISVPADRATEALQLLAKAIKVEMLQLNLLITRGDRYVVISPDSVLELGKDR